MRRWMGVYISTDVDKDLLLSKLKELLLIIPTLDWDYFEDCDDEEGE